MTELIIAKILRSIVTIPQPVDWLLGAILLLGYGILACSVGFATGWMRFKVVSSFSQASRIFTTSLFAPAFLEELVFRVACLPVPKQNLDQLSWQIVTVNVIVFVFYHPLNALTFFPRGRMLFFQPIFLMLAGFLGSVCLMSYLFSGSLWLPVIIHWLVVSCWLIFFDGYGLLYQKATNNL